MTYDQATELLKILHLFEWDFYSILFLLGAIAGILLFRR